MGISSLALKKKKEDQSVFPLLAVFQVTLSGNCYTRKAYFGVASSELHMACAKYE